MFWIHNKDIGKIDPSKKYGFSQYFFLVQIECLCDKNTK